MSAPPDGPSPAALRRARRLGWIVVALAIAAALLLTARRIARRAPRQRPAPTALDAGAPSGLPRR